MASNQHFSTRKTLKSLKILKQQRKTPYQPTISLPESGWGFGYRQFVVVVFLRKRKSKNNKKEPSLRSGNDTLYRFLKKNNKKEALHGAIRLSLRWRASVGKEENLTSEQRF